MGTVSWTRGDGPLVSFAYEFKEELIGLGYTPSVVKHYGVLMGQLNRWLGHQELVVGDLTRGKAEEFLASLQTGDQRRVPTMVTLGRLLGYLRGLQAAPPEEFKAPSPRDELVVRYQRHLIHDRGLTPKTVGRYVCFAKRFLAGRALRIGTEIGVENLESAEINAFLLEASSRLVVESAKREAADLRALLRFLYFDGVLQTDLGSAMPPVATWRGTRLPTTMSSTDVNALLASCDRSTTSGRRDYAILSLLARLGLRSGEVAALQLGDVNWRIGELLVRGKARRQDRLPLPVEVGEALVSYLRNDRPACEWPQMILTLYAPPRPIQPGSITGVVYRACRRAQLTRVGGHRLRHALATEMLARGGSLIEIAQVLRQSDLDTTAGYAKVDRVALRSVAHVWPGVAR
jgi:integrase/recombinase XerD